MKYILLIGDGMADNPLVELDNITPLEKANTPLMDSLASKSEIGTVRTVPKGIEPGSDTATLNILGYDPRKYFTGRSPLEAAGTGLIVKPFEVSYRCNMVALSDDDVPYGRKAILSHSGGAVANNEAIELMNALLNNPDFSKLMADNEMVFRLGNGFRHIALQKETKDIDALITIPPHDHLGEVIEPFLPHGNPLAQNLSKMMQLAHEILNNHPVNEKRREEGKLPANGIWFWAQGKAIILPNFSEKHNGKKGIVISAVPLTRGIGALAGLDFVEVEGATGELDTNYEGKAVAAIDALKKGWDFAVVHVEAPDECTHNGDLKGKLQAIEWLDGRCLKTLLDEIEDEPCRILIISDHKTLMETRGHDGEPVPYILYDSRTANDNAQNKISFNEANCENGNFINEGSLLMAHLFEEV